MIIGLKKFLYELDQTDPGSEFFDEEKSSIGRKISTVKFILICLLLFSEMVFRIVIEDLFLLVND